MTRDQLLRDLAEAEYRVLEGERRVRDQRGFIDELANGSYDTTYAEDVLGRFAAAQAMHIAVLKLVRRELEVFEAEHPSHDSQ